MLASVGLWACSHPALAPRVAPPPDTPAVPVVRAGPRAIGTIILLAVELPEAGRRIGGHFEGALYDTEVASLRMPDGARQRWADASRDAGDSLLRAAGYTVRRAPARSSDAEPLPGVRFGLSAEVSLSVRTVGRVEPRRVIARADATWELLDLASGAAVYAALTHGAAQLDDSIGAAVVMALTRSLGQLLADSAFQLALATPRPRTLEDVVFEALWERPAPGPNDTVWIEPDDHNSVTDLDPVQRVASGVFTVHGRGDRTTTGMAITRGGLALATGVPVREPRLWGRFSDGVDRPLRVLRSSGGLSLLQVQCTDPCVTVPWADSIPLRHAAPVFIVAGPPRRGEPFFVARGRLYLRQPRNQDITTYELGVHDAYGGEPVARESDGTVFALANGAGAVLLRHAFRALGVAMRPKR